MSEWVRGLDNFAPEIEKLEMIGVVAQHEDGDWEIRQGGFLWWLTDELRRNVREESDFRSWLRAQELDSLLTSKERQKLKTAATRVLELVGSGARTLIDAAAKVFGGAAGTYVH